MKMEQKKKENNYCSCGFPQSYPIPHKHDWTEREKRIVGTVLQNVVSQCEKIMEAETKKSAEKDDYAKAMFHSGKASGALDVKSFVIRDAV